MSATRALLERRYLEAQERLISDIEGGGLEVTTVPIRKSYAGYATGLSVVAAVPQVVAARIADAFIAPLRAIDASHHFYLTSELHVTVKNIRCAALGVCFSVREIDSALAVVESVARRTRAFSFSLRGLARFGSGISVVAFAPLSYVEVVRNFDRALAGSGLRDDKQYGSGQVYFGNVTVCRLTAVPTPEFMVAIDSLRRVEMGELRVSSVALIECDEVCSEKSVRRHATIPFSA